ncbi:MAG: hypothetical protein NC907_05505, partial [Candidatus Omnitrophica bacterium]|nr:hypothetical protein [Candidatus Omnitrophota bacterium]
MKKKKSASVKPIVSFTSQWYEKEFGIRNPNPWETDPDEFAEISAKASRNLYEKFSDIGLGNPDPEPVYYYLQPDVRHVCAMAFGAGEPRWIEQDSMFWFDRTNPPLKWANTVEHVRNLKIPVWQDQPLIRKMIDYNEKLAKRNKYSHSKEFIVWHREFRETMIRFAVFVSFIDIGNFLWGTEDFFVYLASDAELSETMLEFCFNLSTSYTEFLHEFYGIKQFNGISSFGGDFSCMLSPGLYEKYAMGFDMKLIEKYGNLFCNLHSCGPSSHLYDVWAKYPNREKIVFMQTRYVSGMMRKLRRALPDTYLQITLHPPQFDFENETKENIKAAVSEIVDVCEDKGIDIVVIIAKSGERIEENIRYFVNSVNEL